ncbi:MAG: GspH/FimT family pseudopilin [Chromatiales bacterium]|jgi:type IV fimbrial biogenesis protein FimT
MQRNATQCLAARPYGISLVELLITLVITTIVLGIGLPAYISLGAHNQQTAEINRFITHLQLARSCAVKTGNNHILCPSNDMISCRENTHWEDGYILFEDNNQDGVRDKHESLVQISRPTRQIGIDMRSTEDRKRVIYRADGHSAGSNLTLTFCDPEQRIPPKAVILSNAGRPRVATIRWDGTPLTCDD